jgi:hypothetical protein
MYPRFSCLVPLVYLLSQVLSCVSVFLCYPFLNVSLVFLFGPFSLLTFTGCVLCVGVSGLSVLEWTKQENRGYIQERITQKHGHTRQNL